MLTSYLCPYTYIYADRRSEDNRYETNGYGKTLHIKDLKRNWIPTYRSKLFKQQDLI